MDADLDAKVQIVVLRHVTATLWANVLRASPGNVDAKFDEIRKISLDSVEAVFGSEAAKRDGMHDVLHLMLHHQEQFWDSVSAQLHAFQAP